MKWLDFDPKRQAYAYDLLSHVRLETIPASELVREIQPVARMMQDPQCHRLLVDAMNYHLLPYQQNTLQSCRTKVRGSQPVLLTIGGRPSLTERALSREVSQPSTPLLIAIALLICVVSHIVISLTHILVSRYYGETLVMELPHGAIFPSFLLRALTSV